MCVLKSYAWISKYFVPNKFIFNSNFILSFWRILIHGWIMWPLSYTYLFDLTCRAERQSKREGERVCQIEFSDLQVHTPNAHNLQSAQTGNLELNPGIPCRSKGTKAWVIIHCLSGNLQWSSQNSKSTLTWNRNNPMTS